MPIPESVSDIQPIGLEFDRRAVAQIVTTAANAFFPRQQSGAALTTACTSGSAMATSHSFISGTLVLVQNSQGRH
jgi:hypothetical protein